MEVGVVGDVDFDLSRDGAIAAWMIGEILCACGKEVSARGRHKSCMLVKWYDSSAMAWCYVGRRMKEAKEPSGKPML